MDQNAAWAPNPNAPRLHALIIGINFYPFSVNLPILKSAISDADAFERYLIEDLRVPVDNIRNLRGENATRSNILNALHSLQVDSNILFGDAIIIYYSGHGGTAPAPPGWHTGGGRIQMILPSDCGPSVYGIPGRTIGVLLETLARARGDNITVIFDCCFSGSGTRSDDSEEQTRGVNMTLPFPPGLDEEILAANNRGTAIPERFLQSGLRSHVLLAACTSRERAREAHGSGYFTKALLDTLKSMRVDTITYTELMDHLPKLPTQNPQCEGYNRNRILFNARVTSNSFFHKITIVEGGYEIGVGEAYGITQLTLFVVYPSRLHASSGPPLQGYVRPLRISPFKTLLNIPLDIAAIISQDAVVLQVRVGVEEAFPVCISGGSRVRLDGFVDGVRNGMKQRGMRELVVVNESSAKLGLNLRLDNTTSKQVEVVAFRILDPSISRWGLNRIHYTVPLSHNALFHVLSAASQFDWHLHRESRVIGTSQVDIEFMRLREISETIDRRHIGGRFLDITARKLKPCGPNMIEAGNDGNVVFVDVAEEETVYGMKLTNKTNTPLYVSVLYFDSSDLSIKPLHESTISTSQSTVEAPLQPQQSLPIGYGSSGFSPFTYFLREGQEIDVGTLKFYFSTEAVDLMYLRQASPFGVRKGGPVGDIRRGYGHRPAWGTVEVRVVQRRALRTWGERSSLLVSSCTVL